MFSWPTDYDPSAVKDVGSFNRSEEVAWNSALPLLNYLEQLNTRYNGQVHMFAHSQGNVVASEALRIWANKEQACGTPIVSSYVLSNAAVSARAYSATAAEYFPHIPGLGEERIVPDLFGNYPVDNKPYFSAIHCSAERVINFYNDGDQAFSRWVFDQNGLLNKPDNGLHLNEYTTESYRLLLTHVVGSDLTRSKKQADYEYYVDSGLAIKHGRGATIQLGAFAGVGTDVLDNNRYEVFAYLGQSYSKAAGADEIPGQTPFDEQIDISVFPGSVYWTPFITDAFYYAHSGMFLGDTMHRSGYWKQLLTSFNIEVSGTTHTQSTGSELAMSTASGTASPSVSSESYQVANLKIDSEGHSQKIVVLDTGSNLVSNQVVLGPDFGDLDSISEDSVGHGTEIAAAMLSSLNNYTNSSLTLALKVTSDSTRDAQVIAIKRALQWAIENRLQQNITTINISLGTGNSAKNEPMFELEPLFKTLNEQGVFIVVASGNSYGPSAAEGLNIIAASQYVTAVGSTWDHDVGYQSFSTGAIDYSTAPDRISSFSQRDRGLDILAPGGAITTIGLDGKPVVRSGTSFAAPQVAAAAAIIRGMADGAGLAITPNEIRVLLRSTGKLLFDGDDEDDNVPNTYRYYPRLDVDAAVAEMQRRINIAKANNTTSTSSGVAAGPANATDSVFEVTPTNGVGTQTPIMVQANPGLGNPTSTWTFQGYGQLDGTDLLLSEHQQLVSNATRTFALNPTKKTFKFEIRDLLLQDNGVEQPPDALEVALATQAGSGSKSYFGRINALNKTDGLLNIQRDGSYFAGSGVNVTGTLLTNGKLDLAKPILVTVDISALPTGTNGTLSFDLIGFGVPSSSVRIIVPEGENTQNSVTGFVYVDSNNNGSFDSGEQPISGATVTLSGSASRTVVTGSNGAYLFNNLLDGTYTVTETQPTVFNDGRDSQGTPVSGTTANDRFVDIVLTDNVSVTNYNFGELELNTISGFVYVDSNTNGLFDIGERPIPGVTINLSGDASRTTTTGTDGSYKFDNLLNGSYSVSQVQPVGFNDGRDTQGTPVSGNLENDRFTNLTLTANNKYSAYNFGEQEIIIAPSNSISGFVYVDANDNGLFDQGELPISGATITLTGVVNLTVNSRTDGSYRFDALPNGVYTVTQNQVVGFSDGRDSQGTPALGTVENDRFGGINLSGNVTAINYNFGEREIVVPQTNSIAGFVYVDANDNGLFDAGEQPISGAVTQLTGPVSQSFVTSTDGAYRFVTLPNGVYSIQQQQPAGFADGRDTQGAPALGTVESDRFVGLNLSGNISASNYNFGERLLVSSNSSLSGSVYIDLNKNGRRDNDEPGLRQVEIRLSGTVTRSVFTNVSGQYSFENLPAGTYSIFEVQPLPYDDGQESVGTQGGTTVEDGVNSIVLDGNVIGQDYNFGEYLRPAQSLNSIGGIVYLDVNNNGKRDAKELVLPNVQITLTGTVTSTTFSGSDGTYVFVDLPDGVYTITQTHPVDFLDGIDSLGTPNSGVAGNDELSGVTLTNNTTAVNYNFSERGLRFPTKAHLLASTPPADQIILQKMQGFGLRAFEISTEPLSGFNPHLPFDVSNDGHISPLDVLLVISALSHRRDDTNLIGQSARQGQYIDPNNDGQVTPLDALLIISDLSKRSSSLFLSSEGEANLDSMDELMSGIIPDDHKAVTTSMPDQGLKPSIQAVDEAFADPDSWFESTDSFRRRSKRAFARDPSN
jgi:Subtilase family/SdrD B-like domain/Dockerin type I domain